MHREKELFEEKNVRKPCLGDFEEVFHLELHLNLEHWKRSPNV